ncbi:MAG: hypothetical protein C0485_09550 [Pirellula sp.]|nr:hypothetical protein [Pirellula sp.]
MMTLRLLRPRFTLRAMLVAMTLVASFLWYHVSWVTQRHQLLNNGSLSVVSDQLTLAPPPLQLFGESGYSKLWVHSDLWHSETERARLRTLFPEAEFRSGTRWRSMAPATEEFPFMQRLGRKTIFQ